MTANQAVVDERYPYLLTEDWDYGYRFDADPRGAGDGRGAVGGRRWPRSSSTRANPMAGDPACPTSSTSRRSPSPYYRNALNLLRQWDFTSPADSARSGCSTSCGAPVLEKTFHDDLRRAHLA